MADAALQSVKYKTDRARLLSLDECWEDEIETLIEPFDEKYPIFERQVMATINCLGFSMLCGHPLDPGIINQDLSMQMLKYDNEGVAYIIQRLVQWIDFYGTLEATKWRLMQFAMSLLDLLEFSDISYLRLASALRDEEFFKFVLNRKSLMDISTHIASDSMDSQLGLNSWITHYQSFLNNLIARMHQRLFDITDQNRRKDKVHQMAFYIWYDWLAKKNRFEMRHWLFSQYIYILLDHDLDLWACLPEEVEFHKLKAPFRRAVKDLLSAWRSEAGDMIREFITEIPCAGLSFRINNREFFSDRGFPWDFRDSDISDDSMLSLLAAEGTVHDRRDLLPFESAFLGFHYPLDGDP